MGKNNDDKFNILFEPVKIGPVIAPNRFYQVPHSCGYGHREPSSGVEIRRIKAEGGWGVVCTEQTEIHPSSDMSPFSLLRNWDSRDTPLLKKIADAVHNEGSLAAIQLSHSGANTSNLNSRMTSIAPSTFPIVDTLPGIPEPYQARGMTKRDILQFRRWHKSAVARSMEAGFDIIYVYAGQLLSLPGQFISERFNRREDEYGGSLLNRLRLLKELIDDTLEVTQGKHAVAVRLTVDEFIEKKGNTHPKLDCVFDLIGELPDIWDITVSGWSSNVAGTSRFDVNDDEKRVIKYIRNLTTKPIVAVRLFNTVDDMVELVKSNVVDFVGSARQSIADPFMPNKIRDNRLDEIRYCVKCNVCVASDLSASGVRCTQNPTFGEEWRRKWHPERIKRCNSGYPVAVVGSGPAGLECARVLGQKGCDVLLYEKANQMGGRLIGESSLPNMELWWEVASYRLRDISKSKNVNVKTGCTVDLDLLLEAECKTIILATGSTWRRDGLDRRGGKSTSVYDQNSTYTPDDIFNGRSPTGHVVVYDDNHYYMGGAISEFLSMAGCKVTFVTPSPTVSSWTHLTMEHHNIQAKLIRMGVNIVANRYVNGFSHGVVSTECVFTGHVDSVICDSIMLVTMRESNDSIALEMDFINGEWERYGIEAVHSVGDSYLPGLIGDAVRSGYERALQVGQQPVSTRPFQRDMHELFSSKLRNDE